MRARKAWVLMGLVLAVPVAAACAVPRPEPSGRQQAPVRLEAALVSPTDITLRRQGHDPGAAGYVIEFATEPAGPYTILGFLPPEQTSYTHPDLMPRTTFSYRLRPYYGAASAPVDVALGGGPYPEPDPRWAEPRVLPGGSPGTRPVGSEGAAPTGLEATVTQADGVAFRWADQARDEEGFLLEDRPAGRPGYRVTAVLAPDVNAFGLVTLPEERHASYRVRAFRYGPPSDVVQRTTGDDTPSPTTEESSP